MNTQTLQKWENTQLGNVVILNYGKGLPARNRVSGEFPVYGSAGIVGHHNTPIAKAPGIIVGRKGSIGEIYFSKKDYYPIDTAYYINSSDKYDIRFIYFLLQQLNLKALNTDAAVPGLNRNVAYQQKVRIPNLHIQKSIADVLFTYDDLIQNNTHRIQILEQIAQAIYTEWFVNFRFPGHEKVRMVDSGTDFGKIPEGWSIGKLSDLANITMGQSPSSDFYNESGEGSPFHQGVTNFDFRFPTTTTFSTGGTRRASAGDILFSVRAPVGRINVADRDMIIGRGLSAMRSISESQSYLLYNLKNLFATEDLIGGGAIYASVTRADLSNFPVVIPDAKAISLFEEMVSPFDGLIFNISHSLSVLRHSRDLLLPKLVTGGLTISN